MDRRGFLKRISAAAAAFTAASAGGLALPARTAFAAPKAIGLSISANMSKFEQTIGAAGREVVALLRQCRVTSLSGITTCASWREVRAVFEMADESAPRTHLDERAWATVENGSLKSLTVTQTAGSVDICDYFGYVEKPHYEIEATWLVPTS